MARITTNLDATDASPSKGELARFCHAVNVTTGRSLATHVEWAGDSPSRRRGLLGRNELDRNGGMYIVPTQWIHMFGMRFPIDVAFLDARGRVLYIHHSLKPYRVSRIVWRAEGALELKAGVLRATHTQRGDIIELQPHDADAS